MAAAEPPPVAPAEAVVAPAGLGDAAPPVEVVPAAAPVVDVLSVSVMLCLSGVR
jgi:hypothetical protein